jgi:uncharacterized protein YdeI (YjbR/CyaY-like superfamily)
MAPGRDGIAFAAAADWDDWLAAHHADAGECWLKIARKGSEHETVTHAEALDVAITWGWIDAVRHALDDDYFLQRFTPRTPHSKWSKRNRDKVEALAAQGRMKPAGLREVERAQADGRWAAAYDGQRTMAVPDDLRRELDARPTAAAFFAGLDSRNRYAILYRLQDAKRPETRARNLAKFVAMLEAGETIYPALGRRQDAPAGRRGGLEDPS